MYGAWRPAEEDTYYWRIAQFMMPFYTIPPEGRLGEKIGVRCWVPVDDNHTMFTSMSIRNTNSSMARKDASGNPLVGLGGARGKLPDGTGWLERHRYEANKANDYYIDREAQKTRSFTGIAGIHMQDQAITESMDPIVDRTRERLGTSDGMIIKTRQRLINAAPLAAGRRACAGRRQPRAVPRPLRRRHPASQRRLVGGDGRAAEGVRRAPRHREHDVLGTHRIGSERGALR